MRFLAVFQPFLAVLVGGILAGGSLTGWAADEQRYLSALPDVPLMAGMVEDDNGSSFVFDKAEGRVVQESVLAPHLSETGIRDFYQRALPALGWKAVESGRFTRNQEQLIVKIRKVPDGAFVTFALEPESR